MSDGTPPCRLATTIELDLDLYSRKLGPTEIRLLTIRPGAPGATIDCTLSHHDLRCGHPYRALSYTWGSDRYLATILLNGSTFQVRSNLYAALTRLRDEEAEVVLWVDAICINQRSNGEKSVHIPIMHQVYLYAEEVIVWLGAKSEDSDEAMGQVEMLAVSEEMEPVVENLMRSARARGFTSQADAWRPLAKLFGRGWWSRVWVLQEVAFAYKGAIVVHCGSKKLGWEYFAACSVVLMQFHESGGFYDKTQPGRLGIADTTLAAFAASADAVNIIRKKPYRLGYALGKLALNRKATDPRDKVFGILNMVSRDDWPCDPDYDMDVREVYTRTAKHIIERSGNLNLLGSCSRHEWIVPNEHLPADQRLEPIRGLPSWVPDWTMIKLTAPFPGAIQFENDEAEGRSGASESQHSSSGAAYSRFELDGSLLVHCSKRVCIDDVDKEPTLSIVTDIFKPAGMRALDNFIGSHIDPNLKDFAFDIIMDIEYSLLTCNTIRSSHSTTTFTRQEYASWRQFGVPSPDAEFVVLVQVSVLNRLLVHTKDGNFALVPWGVKTGDWLARVEGCHIPLVLRGVGEARSREDEIQGRQYMLYGDAFVLGWGQEESRTDQGEEIRLV